jgi:hypothetical protein
MSLAQPMLAGRGLEAFLSEWRAQDTKNKTRKANEQTDYTPQHIYDCVIFDLAIRTFDIQSGWRDTFERQREYTRRDLFMGKLSPEKFSQRLQDLNKYLDYIPIERTTMADKIPESMGHHLLIPWSPSSWLVVDPNKYWAYNVCYIYRAVYEHTYRPNIPHTL